MINDSPVYHPILLFHYGLADRRCLATIISSVVVTAVVAICSNVAQLLCPGVIAHCFSVPSHTHTTVLRSADPIYTVSSCIGSESIVYFSYTECYTCTCIQI